MTWPRNPRISDSLRERNRHEPAEAFYEDNAAIRGKHVTLADLRHLVDSTEGWPAGSRVYADTSVYTDTTYLKVIARDTM